MGKRVREATTTRPRSGRSNNKTPQKKKMHYIHRWSDQYSTQHKTGLSSPPLRKTATTKESKAALPACLPALPLSVGGTSFYQRTIKTPPLPPIWTADTERDRRPLSQFSSPPTTSLRFFFYTHERKNEKTAPTPKLSTKPQQSPNQDGSPRGRGEEGGYTQAWG